ncbi:MAG: HDOD domain-containing protein [Gammaproteobacteria bacterium]|nr:HDOD domain-containing protein [Gammaproteobacteria bacterium]
MLVDKSSRRQTSTVAFEFVRELAGALSSGDVQLPSFPDVSARIQKTLADENVPLERVVRIVGSEPVLAARVMTLANSAAMNLGGSPISELRSAVTRLGFDNLRSMAISFAVVQLQRASEYQEIEKPLTALWQRSVHMAATCFVIARRTGRINSDTALLAGLVHGVGRIYLLARASRHQGLVADQQGLQSLMRDWHASIARALLESWRFPEEIITAVHTYEAASRERRGAALADVLAVADILVTYRDQPEEISTRLAEARPAALLGLDARACAALLQQSAEEVRTLMDILGR